MKRIGFFALIVLIGAAAAITLWWRDPRVARSSPKGEPLEAELSNLREQVAALSARESKSPNQVVVNYASPTPSASAQLEPPVVPETDAEKWARLERRAQAMAESLDVRLLTEPRDVAWGNEQSARAVEALGRVPGATVLATTCASTVCRVELSQEALEQQLALGSSISSQAPFDQGTLYRYDRDAKPPKTTLYVVREGHDLAALTAADLEHVP